MEGVEAVMAWGMVIQLVNPVTAATYQLLVVAALLYDESLTPASTALRRPGV